MRNRIAEADIARAMTFAANLGLFRRLRGETRQAIARSAEISYIYLVDIESVKVMPSTVIQGRIAAALGVTVAEMFTAPAHDLCPWCDSSLVVVGDDEIMDIHDEPEADRDCMGSRSTADSRRMVRSTRQVVTLPAGSTTETIPPDWIQD